MDEIFSDHLHSNQAVVGDQRELAQVGRFDRASREPKQAEFAPEHDSKDLEASAGHEGREYPS